MRHKTGGRKPGSKNKFGGEMREKLKQVFIGEIDGIPELLTSLQPKEKLELIAKFLPFVLPRLEAVAMTVDSLTDNELDNIFNQLSDVNKSTQNQIIEDVRKD